MFSDWYCLVVILRVSFCLLSSFMEALSFSLFA